MIRNVELSALSPDFFVNNNILAVAIVSAMALFAGAVILGSRALSRRESLTPTKRPTPPQRI